LATFADCSALSGIIVGEFDQLTPLAISSEMARRIKGSKLTVSSFVEPIVESLCAIKAGDQSHLH
jgi:hypothetical protein